MSQRIQRDELHTDFELFGIYDSRYEANRIRTPRRHGKRCSYFLFQQQRSRTRTADSQLHPHQVSAFQTLHPHSIRIPLLQKRDQSQTSATPIQHTANSNHFLISLAKSIPNQLYITISLTYISSAYHTIPCHVMSCHVVETRLSRPAYYTVDPW